MGVGPGQEQVQVAAPEPSAWVWGVGSVEPGVLVEPGPCRSLCSMDKHSTSVETREPSGEMDHMRAVRAGWKHFRSLKVWPGEGR